MNIAIIMEYAHKKVGVKTMTIKAEQLPIDVAPCMLCYELDRLPTKPTYLGKSFRHRFPSDVIVIPITQGQKMAIDNVYRTPVEELEPGESEEYYHRYDDEIRAEAAINLAKSFM